MHADGPFDQALDALRSRERRRLLVALLDHNPQPTDGTVAVSEPFDSVAEVGTDPTHTQASLVHVHLPKLKRMGYITWDREAGQIETGPNWAEIEPLLGLLRNHPEALPDDWV
jgi:hypothetical protein